MKTEITYIHNSTIYREIVRCRNSFNAPAVLFIRRPHLDPLRTKIIQCLGMVKFSRADSHFHSYQNAKP